MPDQQLTSAISSAGSGSSAYDILTARHRMQTPSHHQHYTHEGALRGIAADDQAGGGSAGSGWRHETGRDAATGAANRAKARAADSDSRGRSLNVSSARSGTRGALHRR